MALNASTIFIFGDQVDETRPHLSALLEQSLNPIVKSFLERAYDAIRAEILRLQPAESDRPDRSSKLSHLLLLGRARFGSAQVPLEHALTTMCHFGLYFEACGQSKLLYANPHSAYMAGLCTGSLAASAVSCCENPLDLLPLAVDVCVLAFRAGEVAVEMAERFDCGRPQPHQLLQPWAMRVPGSDVEAAIRRIDEFVELKKLPPLSRPFVSTIGMQSLTVSGPSETLSEMREMSVFPGAVSLPIYAPYHAPHLFCEADIHRLLGSFVNGEFETRTQTLPMVRSDGVGLETGHSLKELLAKALQSVFLEQSSWYNLVRSSNQALERFPPERVVIVPMACGAGRALSQALGSSCSPLAVELASVPLPPSPPPGIKDSKGDTAQSKIAIVGMSGRFPGADDLEGFWDLLRRGLDVHKVTPPLRWDVQTHVDVSGQPRKNTSATPYGCWLEQPGLFDAKFFGMSPREAEQVDPAQRLALMTTYEALEDGGLVPGVGSMKRDRVGVCYGVTSNDWMETNSAQDIDTYMIPGGNRAFISGRVNYFFKFSGPSLTVDTACSSSLAAIHTACNILWRGEADAMITGGTNIMTNPDFTAGLDRGRFLSRTGNCKTFDDGADGYCRGEGVVSVVLKRLEDALQDRDPIQGLIVNICTNHSAETESITRPSLRAQKDVVTRALGGRRPANVSYVEMHGTGTQVGDATEMASIMDVVAPSSGLLRRSETQVHIGSAKANVGHGEAVAGATSLVKLLLMQRENIIPPHIGLKTRINTNFPADLFSRGVRIASHEVEWRRRGPSPRYALLNNFSAAGGNTSLLLQDAPPEAIAEHRPDPRSALPVVLSAKTVSALYANARALVAFIRGHLPLEASALSYTTTARRSHHAHRIAVSGSSMGDMAAGITNALEAGAGKTKVVSKSVIFAFDGQGSHYAGMGKELYHHIPSFANDINRYEQMGLGQGFASFLPPDTRCGYRRRLLLIRTSATGHCLSGDGTHETMVIMGGMLDVRASISVAVPFTAETGLEVSCINGPQSIVLGGAKAEVELVSSRLLAAGIPSRILALPYAFHSSQVDGILDGFGRSICGVRTHPARIPVLCPRTEQVIRTGGVIHPAHFVDHCRNQVNFVAAIEAGEREQVVTDRSLFLSVGHTSAIAQMVNANLGSRCQAVTSLREGRDTWAVLSETLGSFYLAGLDIRWGQFHRHFANSTRQISLPRYQWDLKDYWIQYRNDWSLRKGDPPQMASFKDSILSSTIHQVINEEMTEGSGALRLRSDLSIPALGPIVQGHKVDGIPLCTPSIYADIALTAARYLQARMGYIVKGKQPSIDNMAIERALIPRSIGPQWLQTDISIENGVLKCLFATVRVETESLTTTHATCAVHFTEPPSSEWKHEQVSKTQAEISRLREGVAAGRGYRFSSNMVYRMVASLADFGRDYRGLDEVVLDSDIMAAASTVDLGRLPRRPGQSYAAHPACVDAFSQAAGFVMNANEQSQIHVECFVNHGWDSLRIYETLDPDNQRYSSYVQMMQMEDSMVWQGTLTVVRENQLVAIFNGIKIQGGYQALDVDTPPRSEPETAPPHQHQDKGGACASPLDRITAIVAEESGIDTEDLDDDMDLASVGIDSLLSLLVTSRLKDELGFDIGPGLSIFDAYATIGQLKSEYAKTLGCSRDTSTPTTTSSSIKSSISARPATSVTLQRAKPTGPDATAETLTLFLFPDGSGSPVSYASLAPIAPERLNVVALVCPYRRDPEAMTADAAAGGCTLDGLVASYVAEVRRLQPPHSRDDGPYLLGGWSAGGILAYRAAQMLLDAGATVRDLVLIDSPPPNGGLGRLPPRFYEHCLGEGVFGQIGRATAGTVREEDYASFSSSPPSATATATATADATAAQRDWLIPHFSATVELLAQYDPQPLRVPRGTPPPRIALCWAGRPALDGVRYSKYDAVDGDGEGLRFLTETRSEFGPEGWAELLDQAEPEWRVEVFNEFDHFNIMVSRPFAFWTPLKGTCMVLAHGADHVTLHHAE
ncbi:Type I Polyketide synthases (Type I PKS) [Apiospora saccharicola]